MANFAPQIQRSRTAILGGLLLLLFARAAAADEPVALRGETMGTTYTVKIADPPTDFDAAALKTAIDATLETVNNQMSTWRPDSELSRFNAAQTTDWVPASPALVAVVSEAQQVSAATDGAFDVTVEPLIALWGFDHEGRPDHVPTAAEIAAAQQRCGFSQLEVRTEPPALRKSRPDLSINLSAIAKGYGVDVVAEQLLAAGVNNFMVEIGGEVRTAGKNGAGDDWHIAVESPQSGLMHEIYRVVVPGKRGMATSGDYRNFYEQDGKVFSHTIDPKTGRPIESGIASATVLADSCMAADAWATALMVLGEQRGLQLANQHGLSVMMITHESKGQFHEVSNAGFAELVRDAPAETPAAPSRGIFFLLTLAAFALALTGMAIGVIISNRRIKGSCGGLNNTLGENGRSICDACTTPPEECDRVRAAAAAATEHSDTENPTPG